LFPRFYLKRVFQLNVPNRCPFPTSILDLKIKTQKTEEKIGSVKFDSLSQTKFSTLTGRPPKFKLKNSRFGGKEIFQVTNYQGV
jgi:hypothetical protein